MEILLRERFLISPTGTWEPPVDLYETDQEIVVVVEVAGVDHRSLRVQLDGDRLSISGLRRESYPPLVRIHQMEIEYGYFERMVRLPAAVKDQGVSATYREGFLRISLPKLHRERRIAIEE